jgi:hypothetical protein
MTMSTPSRSATAPSRPGIVAWLLNLATRVLARILNMPEPLVHHTGAFVVAHVAAIESSVGRSLCPIRMLRRLRDRFR